MCRCEYVCVSQAAAGVVLVTSFYIYLVNGWRYPQHFPVRVDQHIGLVSHFVVTISTEKRVKSLMTSNRNHIRLANFLTHCIRQLKHWGREFESHSRHGYLHLFCVFVILSR
jgi:hypothetical protein